MQSQPDAAEPRGAADPGCAVAAVLEACQPLLDSSRDVLRVFPTGAAAAGFDPAGADRCNEVLAAIGEAYGYATPRFVAPAPYDPSALEAALSTFCGLDQELWPAVAGSSGPLGLPAEPPRLGPEPRERRRRVPAAGGMPAFDAFSLGEAGGEAVVVIPPCGVPATLLRPWLAEFGADRLALTYENPYLFGGWESLPPPDGDFAQETSYIGALLREYGVCRAHLIGICGGAPLALAAAADLGPIVASMVLCHPDLNFGPGVTRSPFQAQFQGYLSEAGYDPRRARDVLDLFLDPHMLHGVPPKLAPYVLYPYGDLELFRRYARINHGLMAYDANNAADKADQRLLIITSGADRMTHPDAARHLHGVVAGSVLAERDTGNHHDILLPTAELFARLRSFIDGDGGSP
jgi:pimeloyl-ACP methyl ester carboxylesterase